MINYNNDTEDDDDFERSMDEFLEKVASIDSCYNNGYKLITNKRTLAELTEEKLVVIFPFNPKQKESFLKVADLMINYFASTEEYEKCADLVKVKKEIENSNSN
jgi:hypothetical protein